MDEYVEVKYLVNLAILHPDRTWSESGPFRFGADEIYNAQYGIDEGMILETAKGVYEKQHGETELGLYALVSWEEIYEDEDEEEE